MPINFPDVGGALTQPQAPARSAAAPQEQLGLWHNFQQKLATDPNFRMALLTTGLNMMRTPEPGESGYDVFADASLQGIGTLDQLRQRDIGTERQGRIDALTERGVEAGERRGDIAQQGLEERSAQAAAALAESRRQFDARMAAGDFGPQGGAAGSTGPERMATLAEQQFIDAGIYPDTPEGRGLAGLRAKGLIGKGLVTPQDRMDFAGEIAKDIVVFNPDMTPVEAATRAVSLVNALADPLNQADVSATPSDDLEGQVINHSTQGTGTVVKKGEDRYVVEFPGGNTTTLTGEQIRRMLETHNAQ